MSSTPPPAHSTHPVCLTSAQLAQASTPVAVPFDVQIGPEIALHMLHLLRVLPGRRYVGEARLDEQSVLAKLFVSSAGQRHFERELSGIRALEQARINTPRLLQHGALPGGGYYLLTGFLATATAFRQVWQKLCSSLASQSQLDELLAKVFSLVGQLHAAGLIHDDLHLDNLLVDNAQLLLIDGDSVRGSVGQALPSAQANANLAMLIAQFPVSIETQLNGLLAAYRASHPAASAVSSDTMATAIDQARQARWSDYRSKLARSCSGFVATREWQRRTVIQRSHAELLEPVVTNPDDWVEKGQALKLGNSATVVRVRCGQQSFVIKRYNIKNTGHALSRALRPTRAWHSWIEGHRLERLGIASPAPRAIIESRFGPLRGKSWLIVDDIPGKALHEVMDPSGQTLPDPTLAKALVSLFRNLHRVRISHGDLKASNLIWHAQDLYLIDLDATIKHDRQSTFERAWRKDRARLLRNWPQGSPLYNWLDEVLP